MKILITFSVFIFGWSDYFLSFWFLMSPSESPSPTVWASPSWSWKPQRATAAPFGSRRGEFVVVGRVTQVILKRGFLRLSKKTLSFLFLVSMWRRCHCDVWGFHENKYMMMMMVVPDDGVMKIKIQWLMRCQKENTNKLINKETVSNAVWIPTTMGSQTKI